MPGTLFPVWTCRASFVTRRAVRFPPIAGNAFRGALGLHLDAAWFRPRAETGPSGLRDRPRAFVLRAAHLDGAALPAGARFEADVHLFDERARAAIESALGAIPQFALTGFDVRPVVVDLAPHGRCAAVRAVFRTPLALKGWDGQGAPPFAVLMARIRDRIAALSAFYGSGAPEMDYAAWGARAAAVDAAASELDVRRAERRSTRTGERHPLGGVTGWVRYSGPLDEFLPWLEAAYWTGAGRYTVWGNGWIETVREA